MSPLLLGLALAAAGLQVSADSLVITPGSRVAVLTGNVVAQSDTFDATSEEGEVTYVQKNGKRIIDTLELARSVEATRRTDGARATSDHARWARADDLIVMTGDPVVRKSDDRLAGERIAFGTLDESLAVTLPDVALGNGRETPLLVTAEHLTSPPGGEQLVFKDRVVVTDDDLVTQANHAVVFLAGPSEAREVERAVMTGRVRARRGTQTGRSRKATWDAATRNLVLEGDPVVEQEGERIAGKRITLEADSGRALVETAVVNIKRAP